MLTGQHPYRYTGTHCPQKGSLLPPDPHVLSADRRMNSMPRFTSLSRQSLRLVLFGCLGGFSGWFWVWLLVLFGFLKKCMSDRIFADRSIHPILHFYKLPPLSGRRLWTLQPADLRAGGTSGSLQPPAFMQSHCLVVLTLLAKL